MRASDAFPQRRLQGCAKGGCWEACGSRLFRRQLHPTASYSQDVSQATVSTVYRRNQLFTARNQFTNVQVVYMRCEYSIG